jgi:hypothetical protein
MQGTEWLSRISVWFAGTASGNKKSPVHFSFSVVSHRWKEFHQLSPGSAWMQFHSTCQQTPGFFPSLSLVVLDATIAVNWGLRPITGI